MGFRGVSEKGRAMDSGLLRTSLLFRKNTRRGKGGMEACTLRRCVSLSTRRRFFFFSKGFD